MVTKTKGRPSKVFSPKPTRRVFEVYINGRRTQYLKPSEINLIRWEPGLDIRLVATELASSSYRVLFGLN